VTVPCYLWRNADTPGCQTGSTFKLDEDQKPIRGEDSTYEARFACNIPLGVIEDGKVNKVKTSLYGHGLFGEIWEAPTSRNVRQLGFENDVMVCGADWIGMATEDESGAAIPALQDLGKFPSLPDRLQQGFLNWLFIGRAILHPDGFATHPAFQADPDGADGAAEAESVIDPSDLFYYAYGGSDRLHQVGPLRRRHQLLDPALQERPLGQRNPGQLLRDPVVQLHRPPRPSDHLLDHADAVGQGRTEWLRQPHDRRSPARDAGAHGDVLDGRWRLPGGQRDHRDRS
jgi:hypothetical protein